MTKPPGDALPVWSCETVPPLSPVERETFARALRALNEERVPFVVGGAFAVHAYTGIWRWTKDLDVFLRPADLRRALGVLAGAGFATRVHDPRWLGKATTADMLVDLIFGLGNGRAVVGDGWFERAEPITVAGVEATMLSREQLLLAKLYVAARDRFDGADILHVLRAAQGAVDWGRLLRGSGRDRMLLLWHLLLYRFVYPSHADEVPLEVVRGLWEETHRQNGDGEDFRGWLLDPVAFGVDAERWGYRARPGGVALVLETGELK